MTDDLFVDWKELWSKDREDREWLVENVLVRGRAHALYAKQKQGKSLLTLGLLTKLAMQSPWIRVLYFDYEMTEDDLLERLEDMGYGPETDLSRLHYALLPPLHPLDTQYGGKQLLSVVDEVRKEHPRSHLAVIIDTTSRAVEGEENSADTIRAFYRFTGIGLKQRGTTWLRIDHAGKDDTKGQRGSSAKGDDVDVVWSLSTNDSKTKYTLKREVSRLGWVPEQTQFRRLEDPMRFILVPDQFSRPTGTRETVDVLNKLGVPWDASRRETEAALRAAGCGKGHGIVLAAMRIRRAQGPGTTPTVNLAPENGDQRTPTS